MALSVGGVFSLPARRAPPRMASVRAAAGNDQPKRKIPAPSITRKDFPAGFVFGASTAAYQIEGCVKEGGRGPSMWDTFTHERPDMIQDRSNGDVAVDSYNRYKEDIGFLHDMGMDAYRFSISWPRILPTGSLSGGVNQEGIEYYNNLINSLMEKGLQPYVTLFHWDTPQSLESEYQSFLSQRFVDDYRDFVDICFREFGDRVKYWITFNEPSLFCEYGYAHGTLAPGRCSSSEDGNCSVGDSATEPYIAGHHLLLAHAIAVQLYRDHYQDSQKGKIGITLCTTWYTPYSESKADHEACLRSLDFNLGWFLDPIIYGDYPFIMRALVGDRLPKFTLMQSGLIKGSFDFIGLNYYSATYTQSLPVSKPVELSYETDSYASHTCYRDGKPIGEPAEGSPAWLMSYPEGLKNLLLYIKERYNNPVVYITENGYDERNKTYESLEEALKDHKKIDYIEKHLVSLNEAITNGANVKGYFVWSLIDNFEWASGYTARFGLVFVDYRDGLTRYPKHSFNWFRDFLNPKNKEQNEEVKKKWDKNAEIKLLFCFDGQVKKLLLKW